MKIGVGRIFAFSLATSLALLAGGCKQASKPAASPQQAVKRPAPSVPNIKVSPAIEAKAKTHKPGPHAKRKPVSEAFGRVEAAVHFKGSPHLRSFWAEQLDVNGSGQPVLVNEAWDNHAKILYLSNERTFTCGDGQTATGSTLMAVYAKGNTRKRPAGSGWWVTQLNAGDCAVPRAGLYGCRFNAAGKNSDCGEANVQSEVGDVVIVPLPESGASQEGASGQAAPSTGSASSKTTHGTSSSSGGGSSK